jgi:hypothetical protein
MTQDDPPPQVPNDNDNEDDVEKDNDDPVDAAVQDIAMQVVEGVDAADNVNDNGDGDGNGDANGDGDGDGDANGNGDGDGEASGEGVGNENENDNSATPKKKRLCRYPDCTRVIKSQGHCQRHGAKAKRCKVEGCDKQAQGTHDGMCKRHWKTIHFPQQVTTTSQL